MRYFTKEMWLEAQEPDLQEENRQAWNSALEAYNLQLSALAGDVSLEAFEFFRNANIHDGNFVSVRLLDGSHVSYAEDEPIFNPDPVSANLTIQNHDRTSQWSINYTSIRRAFIDFPSEQPTFYSDGEGFNDIGYHELTDAGQGFLRHELLFSSGASIFFEFKKVVVTSQAV